MEHSFVDVLYQVVLLPLLRRLCRWRKLTGRDHRSFCVFYSHIRIIRQLQRRNLSPIRIAKKHATYTSRGKFVSLVVLVMSETETSEGPQMMNWRRLIVQFFERCLSIQNRCRCSINQICSRQNAFAPKLNWKRSLKSY